MINPYSIPPLISSTIILSLGVFVFTRNRKSQVNLWWMFFCLSLWGWLFPHVIGFSTKSISLANLFGKIAYVTTTAIPISFYFFVRHLLKLKTRKFVYILFLIIYLFIVYLIFRTDWILSGYWKYYFTPSLYWPKVGKFHLVYVILFFLLATNSFALLYRGFKNKLNIYSQEEVKQLKFVFFALLIAWLTGPIEFLLNYGFEFYPPGYICALSLSILITHAILKHQLMDINIVIKKGFVYSVLVAIITAGYLIFVIGIGKIFQGLVGYRSFLVNLFAIFTIAILFNPLRNKIQVFLDKRFFKGTLESLAQERERLKQELFHFEKLAYVGNLASSVAHEIKNPLTAIKTFVEYLPQRYHEPEFKEKFQKFIPQEIKRIEGVVLQLLDLAKPRQPVLKSINIVNVIDSTLSLLENNLQLKKINVQKEYASNEILIQADEEQVKQIFLNLFLNAIQAMSEGGTLTVSINGQSNLRSSGGKESAIICVKDTGCGICEENLKKLFTPFFTTKKEGVGLGLNVTQEIIKQHKGSIKVESKINEGTKFVIELPLR